MNNYEVLFYVLCSFYNGWGKMTKFKFEKVYYI